MARSVLIVAEKPSIAKEVTRLLAGGNKELAKSHSKALPGLAMPPLRARRTRFDVLMLKGRALTPLAAIVAWQANTTPSTSSSAA